MRVDHYSSHRGKYMKIKLSILAAVSTLLCAAAAHGQAVYVPPSGSQTYNTGSPPSNTAGTLGVPVYSASDGALLFDLLDPIPAGTNYIGKVAQQGSWTVLGTFWPYSLGQTTMSASVPVTLASNQSALAVTVASLPLPTGAATAAKQPALGTAGTPSTDVISIQGIASMTAVKVDGSGVTQPVSIASEPLPTGASTAAAQTNVQTAPGTQASTAVTIQGNSSGVAVPVSGTFWPTTQPVSGTVTANAGSGTMAVSASALPLPSGAATATNQTATHSAAGTPDSTAETIQGNASGVPVPVSVSGSATVSGTVTANAGTGTFAISASALPLPAGAATATHQTETHSNAGTPNTTAVTVQGNASGIAVPVSGTFWQATQPISGTITANVGTGTQAGNLTQIAGTAPVTGGVAGLLAVGGPVASAGSNADNPIKIGGVFNTTQPTVTTGEVVDSQATAHGALIVATGVDPLAAAITPYSPLNNTDVTALGNITSTQALTVSTQGAATAFVVVSGSWTGTLQPQVSYDGTNWVNISVVPSNPAAAAVTSITANGQYDLPVAGINEFRVIGATITGGTAAVHVEAGQGSFGTVARQSVAANLNATVVAPSGAALALDGSVTGLQVAQGSTTSGQKGALGLGAVTTTAPTYTTAQTSPLSLTTAGALRTDASATTQPISAASLPLPTGAALDTSVNGLLVSQGSTTSGQKGTLTVGAVTTSAPTYTTGQTSAVSLTTTGALRTDSSATTQPVQQTGYNYTHIATNTTTVVKSGAGILHLVVINTPGATDTATIYDNTAGSGTVIAVLNDASTSAESITYDVNFSTGCTIVTAGTTAPDMSISWR